MSEVLSQSEIDALLSAVSTGNVETEEADVTTQIPSKKGKDDWVAYDLTSQEKIIKGRLLAFQGINDRFCRLFRITLSRVLRKEVRISYVQSDFMKFGEYLRSVLMPVSINVICMKNLVGHLFCVVNSKLTYAILDAYYGGTERPFSKIGGSEEFTTIENNMIQRIVGHAIRDLQEAWKLNYPLELEFIRAESNPNFVGYIHSSESVAVVTFDVQFENLTGPFTVVLQLKAMDPIQHLMSVNITGEIPPDLAVWENHWKKELMEIELEVKVPLGSTGRGLRTIEKMDLGDTLLLDQPAAEPLTILIQDVPKFKGVIGVCHGNHAIRLIE